MSIYRRLFGLLMVAALLNVLLIAALRWPQFAAMPGAAASLRFVDETGAPLANATLRILCYADAAADAPLADLLFTTGDDGHLRQPLPAGCPYLAALRLIHRQPAASPVRDAYWVYDASWEPGSRALVEASGEVTVRRAWRLVLFDLVVALEWEPSDASSYLDELRDGLFAASANLYAVTEGQMAFGPLAISTGGHGWDGADVQIRAANDYRPAAAIGGIVAQTTTYTTPTDMQTVYAPGSVVLGRHWDGFDAADPIAGAWTAPSAYRTLIHEWLHFALFLYDEYQEATPGGRLESFCTCPDLPAVGINPQACGQVAPALAASVMAYHYTAQKLWGDGLPALCLKTDQYRIHGEPDWETLARWGAIQGLAEEWLRKPGQAAPGPNLGLAGDLFGRRPTPAAASLTYLPLVQGQEPSLSAQRRQTGALRAGSEVTVHVGISASLSLTELNTLQAHLYTEQPATGDQPARLVYQGTTTGPRQPPDGLGRATLLGVQPGSRLWVAVEGPGPRGALRRRFVRAAPIDPTPAEQTIVASPDPNSVSLDIMPGLLGAQMQTLTLTFTSATPLAAAPTAQLCAPDAATGCPDDAAWRRAMTSADLGLTWRAVFTATPPGGLPPLGVVQIAAPGGPEVIRWFQTLGGVGPGHRWGHAPLRDGLLMVDATTPLSGSDNLVLMMPTVSDPALAAPLPPGIDGLLTLPLDVDVLLPGDPGSARGRLATPVVMTFFFGREPLARLGLSPAQAQLLHFRPALDRWELLAFSGRSPHLYWLATQPVTETGVFAVGRAVSPTFGETPAMYADAGPIAPPEPLRYVVTLPASPALTTTTMGFFQNMLPPFIMDAQPVACSRGDCFFDPEARLVVWQGGLGPGDRVLLSYDLHIDPAADPTMLPPVFVNQAVAFDGQHEHLLTAPTQLWTVELPTP